MNIIIASISRHVSDSSVIPKVRSYTALRSPIQIDDLDRIPGHVGSKASRNEDNLPNTLDSSLFRNTYMYARSVTLFINSYDIYPFPMTLNSNALCSFKHPLAHL